MTGLHALLEDFGSVEPHVASPLVSEDALESERLESFDKGYRAGWDDAIKAKQQESAGFSTEFAQKLQDLSFTYHDVHAQVLSNLAPLFDDVLGKVLPAIARDSLGAHIVEQLTSLAREIGTATVEIAVGPGASSPVQRLLDEATVQFPITVSEDPQLGDGQAQLRFGRREVAVDLSAMAQQISEAVHTVLYDSSERQAYG